MTRAASIARLTRQGAYKAREANATFAEAWDCAIAHSVDTLESEVRRRAYKGYTTPVFYKGQKVGHIREYSDQLAMFLLRAHRPEKYRDDYRGGRGPAGAQVQVDVDLGAVLDRALAATAHEPMVPGLPSAADLVKDQE